jgi:hypothetical protein
VCTESAGSGDHEGGRPGGEASRLGGLAREAVQAQLLIERAAGDSLVAAGVAVDASLLRPEWDVAVDAVLAASTLERPTPTLDRTRRTLRCAHGGFRGADGRDAARLPCGAGSELVTAARLDLHRARAAAATVLDPEMPVLTIEELGVLRDVELLGERVVVTVTPTYSGCPATGSSTP